MTGRGFTETLCEFSAGTQLKDLPDEVVHTIKRLVLDVIGNAVGGWSTDATKYVLRTLMDFGGAEQATVLVTGRRTSVPHAVFANVTMATALEADDTLLFAHHAQASVLPALAVAESRARSGADLLTSIALGYELGFRVAKASRHLIIEPDGTMRRATTGGGLNWVVFPAALGVAKILELDSAQTASALGAAGFTSTVPTGGRWNRPSWNHMKYNPYSFMAQSGTMAALMAANGFTGDPDIFDGDVADGKANWWQMAGTLGSVPEDLTAELGDNWYTTRVSFKPWPSCRFTHGAIGLFEQIVAAEKLRVEEIESIDYWSNSSVFVFHMDSPIVRGEFDCEFSVPHVIAMAALGVPPGPQWVAPRYWDDPAVESIKAKVHCHVLPKADAVFTEQLIAGIRPRDPHRLDITMRDGRRFSREADYTIGDPHTLETTMSDEALVRKFRTFTEQALSTRTIDRCIDRVFMLDELPDVRLLTEALF
jgi:2-methylcitrate dehydratase PrpD